MSTSLIIFICLLLSAFFSGMEIAFVSANRLRIELDKKQGLLSSRIVSVFTRKPSQFIATMLIGNNIVLVIYGIVISQLLEPFIKEFVYNEFYIMAIQTIISTLFILVTAEFLPKALFRMLPNTFLNGLSIPALLTYIVFYPFTRAIMAVSHWIIKLVTKNKYDGQQDMYVFGKVDLDHLVQDSGKGDKVLDTEHEIRIFQNALDFSSVKVRECMVPRTEVAAVASDTSINELREKFIETGFSKLLVFEGSIDNLIGYVSMKDLFKNPHNLRSKIIRAPIVPETMNANKLLQLLIKERKSIAIVVDEFGGTSGIVTTEDIMEEIFGEIEDEHDTDELVEKKLSDTGFVFSGKLPLEYLNEKYKFEIPESEEYDTLAGYIFYTLGRIPVLNEEVQMGHYSFKILRLNNKRLELIYLKEQKD